MDSRHIVIVLVVVLGLAGCVTKENYNAQVLRTNNFQRLLSEEEKRSVELSTEVARLKDQWAILESKNKALTAQLNDAKAQVVRSLEEVGRLQDEIKQARGGFSSVPALRGPSQEPPDRLGELQEAPAAKPEKKVEQKKGKATAQVKVQKQSQSPPPEAKQEAAKEAAPDDSFFRYHKVMKGETLAGIAKQYRTDAQTLRELNDMAGGDAVRPGDRLIVGQKP
ncbi:MAG: LysM peptidoglycan-binding domain-containing protein [Nitrospiraceae bacterium]|nr:MAG: LysM peptidoglycan-binding domain-containing protein [Nitrospiraceae bacterium]